MKTLYYFLFLFLILFSASCKKNNANPNNNIWTLKSITYQADSCEALQGSSGTFAYSSSIVAITGTTSQNSITIMFSSSSLPLTGGIDTVISSGLFVGDRVLIDVNLGAQLGTGIGGTSYYATGGTALGNQTVNVSVSPTGKISISGQNITMQNRALSTDTAVLNFNLTQTN